MRNRFIEAAARVIASHGTDSVSIDAFIRAAGVARGTFYNHLRRAKICSTHCGVSVTTPFLRNSALAASWPTRGTLRRSDAPGASARGRRSDMGLADRRIVGR